MPPDNPDPTPDFEEIRRMTRLLQPFWDRLEAMQAEHDWMTDANFFAASFEVPDSVLIRMLQDDGRDVGAVRLAIMDVVAANRVPGVGGGMSGARRRVSEAMGVGASSRRTPLFHVKHLCA